MKASQLSLLGDQNKKNAVFHAVYLLIIIIIGLLICSCNKRTVVESHCAYAQVTTAYQQSKGKIKGYILRKVLKYLLRF